ncbi:MAG TPA: DUF4166 domain-containing protein [Planctomycetota bacterium]|nr:DUF4166 domain-containing protein [Planctomycetota bacterium]
MTAISPFVSALGAELERLAPTVKGHLRQASGESLFAGRLRDRWRRGGPIGWLLARILRVDFGAIEASARFELRNALLEGDTMLWRRTLLGARRTIDNLGVMRWDDRRQALVDTIGRGRAIEVELVPSVEDAGMKLTSRGQWLRVLGLRIPLPRWIAGSAVVREREEPGGRMTLVLTLHHPWLGAYAGYEAELEEASS